MSIILRRFSLCFFILIKTILLGQKTDYSVSFQLDAEGQAQIRKYEALYLNVQAIWLANSAWLQKEKSNLGFYNLLEYNNPPTDKVTEKKIEALQKQILSKTCTIKDEAGGSSFSGCIERLTRRNDALVRIAEHITRARHRLHYLLIVFDRLSEANQQAINEDFSKEHTKLLINNHFESEEKLMEWVTTTIKGMAEKNNLQEEDDYHQRLIGHLGILTPINTEKYLKRVYEKMQEEGLMATTTPIAESLVYTTKALSVGEAYQKKRAAQLLEKKLSDVMYKEFALRNAIKKTENTPPNCSVWNSLLPAVNWNFFLWILISPFILFLLKVSKVMLWGSRTRRQREAFRKAWVKKYNQGFESIN